MAKTQAEIDDDTRYRNRFRDGGDDKPMKRHQKKVFNRATGTFDKPAPDPTPKGHKAWYAEKIAKVSENKRQAARTRKKAEEAGG